jgi:hypothetical protein
MTPEQHDALDALARRYWRHSEILSRQPGAGCGGQDWNRSELYRLGANVLGAVARGRWYEDELARADREWRAFAAERIARVCEAPRLKGNGPWSGASAAMHLAAWPEEITEGMFGTRLRYDIEQVLAARPWMTC